MKACAGAENDDRQGMNKNLRRSVVSQIPASLAAAYLISDLFPLACSTWRLRPLVDVLAGGTPPKSFGEGTSGGPSSFPLMLLDLIE